MSIADIVVLISELGTSLNFLDIHDMHVCAWYPGHKLMQFMPLKKSPPGTSHPHPAILLDLSFVLLKWNTKAVEDMYEEDTNLANLCGFSAIISYKEGVCFESLPLH